MTTEFARRIAITIGALLVYRLGCQIPVAGVATHSGLATDRIALLSIFSLSLVPYLSAAIIVQLVVVVWRRLRALERSGEIGRRKYARITLALTLLLAAFQAFGIAFAMQHMPGLVVVDPGDWFVLTATASLVGGVFFLVWLSEQITRHGIGTGLALILSVGILASLPSEAATLLSQLRRGAISGNLLLGSTIFLVVLVALIVFIECARRNVPVQFVARRIGERTLPSSSAVLPIKINSAGYLLPVTVAPWMISLPLAFAGFIFGADAPWLETIEAHLQFGEQAHIVLGSIAVFALAFVYTAFVVDPDHAAESLVRFGGVIPGVMPGEATAIYLDRVASSITVVGAAYLTAISLIPEVFLAYGNGLHYKMGGGAALIVICTILDLQTRVRDVSLTIPGGVRR